jgi:SPP1 family predicted phage head-tail adaptor
MSIGGMRHKLKLQSSTRTSDGGGGASIVFNTFSTVFGSITPQAGSERFFGQQVESRVTHVITIRFRRDISSDHRIVYDYYRKGKKYSRTFNIKSVINRDTKDRYIDLLCEEGVAT